MLASFGTADNVAIFGAMFAVVFLFPEAIVQFQHPPLKHFPKVLQAVVVVYLPVINEAR